MYTNKTVAMIQFYKWNQHLEVLLGKRQSITM